MSDVIVRFATKDDVDQIVQTLEAYNEESNYKDYEPLDPEMTVMYAANFVENHVAIIAEVDGKVQGLIFAGIELSMWKRAECSMSIFYVRPEWRGSPMGNKLVEAWIKVIKKRNYMFGMGGSTSGWGEKVEKQFGNMLEKHGLKPVGRCYLYMNQPEEQAT